MKVILDDYLVPTKKNKPRRKKKVMLDHYLVRRFHWKKRQKSKGERCLAPIRNKDRDRYH